MYCLFRNLRLPLLLLVVSLQFIGSMAWAADESLVSLGMAGHQFGKVEPHEFMQGPPAEMPGANVMILIDDHRILMAGRIQKHSNYYSHKRLLVLNTAGIEEIGDISFTEHKDMELVDLRAHTVWPDGTVQEVAEDQIFKKRIGDFITYSLSFPRVDSGTIVEYAWQTSARGFPPIFSHDFANRFFTKEARLGLVMGSGMQFVAYPTNLPPGAGTPSESFFTADGGKRREFIYRVTNILPMEREPYMSGLDNYIPRIAVQLVGFKTWWGTLTGFRNWQEVGRALYNSIDNYLSLPRGYRKLVRRIARDYETKYDKSQALYDWVTDSINTDEARFETGFANESLSDLFKTRSGTGMEKNILLIDMMQEMGIDAWPIFIATRDYGTVDPASLWIDQFNHVIAFVEVEQGGIYLDASSAFCPYGTLPPNCRSEVGLLVEEENSNLVRIVTSEPRSYRMDVTNFTISPEGTATGSVDASMIGYLAIDFGRKYETMGPTDFVREELLTGLPVDAEIRSHECHMDEDGKFTARVELEWPSYATSFAGNMAIPTVNFMFNDNPFTSDKRLFPIDFKYPFTYHHAITIQTADSSSQFQFETLEPVRVAADGAEFMRAMQETPAGIRVDCKLTIQKPQFGVGEYSMVKQFFDEVTRAGTEEIVAAAGE